MKHFLPAIATKWRNSLTDFKGGKNEKSYRHVYHAEITYNNRKPRNFLNHLKIDLKNH